MAAEGPRLLADLTQGPFSVYIVDDAAKELSWAARPSNVCYRLPFSQIPELQVRALELFLKRVRADDSLGPADREQIVAKTQAAIVNGRKPQSPRLRTLTWKKSEKLNFPCELYEVLEGEENVGVMCLQVKGAPPKSFTIAVGPGEWWQGTNVFLQQERVPVLIEGKCNGVVLHRATLKSLEQRQLEAKLFDLGKDCKPGLGSGP